MPSGILDSFTSAQVVISSDHHYIHEGEGWVLTGDTGNIAAAGVAHISFKTPVKANGVIHFRPAKFSSSANSASITITRGAVMTGGSVAVPVNANGLYDSKVSMADIKTGATLTTAGVGIIYKENVGTGGVPNRSGGSGGSEEERILAPDTVYSITFKNTGAATATICSYMLFWYEE